jgi:hypothetical protein
MWDIEPRMLVLLAAAGTGILFVLAVALAYRLGREKGLRSRSDRFDRLYVEADFSGSNWAVSDTSGAGDANIVGTMALSQSGTRVMAEGLDLHNRRWSAEGVAFRRGVHLLFVERRERWHAVGSVHLELDDSGQTMTGMKSTWEGGSSGGAIQTVVWNRTPEVTAEAGTDHVEFREHAPTSVANRQHGAPLYRPVDTLVNEVVDVHPMPASTPFS